MPQDVEIIIKRLKHIIENSGLSYVELEKKTGISKSALQRYATGSTKKIPVDVIQAISKAVNVSSAWVMGWDDNINILPEGFMPLPKTNKIPRLGVISCGDPINSEENFDGYDDVPEHIVCDFTLKCEGDSMTGARINDGDLVYIRQQSTVENGQIAAVLVDGTEKLLKRVYINDDSIILQAENPSYPPRVFSKEDMNRVSIIGRAVGFTSVLK
ncbi:MAG: helix-turn-helix domain-containing protein [Clostridia bacterium]|nr:helix-turn-helix domain-containing protein [Clostridia bacterium]